MHIAAKWLSHGHSVDHRQGWSLFLQGIPKARRPPLKTYAILFCWFVNRLWQSQSAHVLAQPSSIKKYLCVPAWSFPCWDIWTLAFSCRICQENRATISVQLICILPETHLEYILGSGLEVNMGLGRFTVDSANNLQALCSEEQVVTKGRVRGNWCNWNLPPVYLEFWISCVWKHPSIRHPLGDKELAATVQMEVWKQKKGIYHCVRNLNVGSSVVFLFFASFKVICYNVIILYSIILFSNTPPTGKSAGIKSGSRKIGSIIA